MTADPVLQGNMDNKRIGPGSKFYLPVEVPHPVPPPLLAGLSTNRAHLSQAARTCIAG